MASAALGATLASWLPAADPVPGNGDPGRPGGDPPPPCANMVTADVVAFDTPIVWNKFGSLDPIGMMYALRRDVVPTGPQPYPPTDPPTLIPGQVRLRDDLRPRPLVLRVNEGDCLQVTFTNLLDPTQYFIDPNDPGASTPKTRNAGFHVVGMSLLDIQSQAGNVGNNAPALASPGQTRVYTFVAEHEGAHLAQSLGALAGGEGDGGSMSHGLFGAVCVEPAGSRWLHSTTGRSLLDDDNSINSGTPYGIVYGFGDGADVDHAHFMSTGPFREFVVMFHDEAHTEHANERLDNEFWLHSVRDAFGINYGISGIGQIVLDALCTPDCRFEEAFLTSWANGDPALLPHYRDDPSNVWHSYMGDRVKIRNIHAGPKETHVFHLHAHQWVYTPKDDDSTYLDSQSIGPAGSFTYDIAYGGSGNRNYTVGDSIFHCHLYPHFAQGMWGLWRVHDVYETGGRRLPDGTPIPRIAPIPGQALPLLPTDDLPGYPFFIPGAAGSWPVANFPGEYEPGHRPPQPPLDMENDAGLPRHVALRGQTIPQVDFVQRWVANSMVNGQVVPSGGDPDFDNFDYVVLPDDGTRLEQQAMRFHARRDLPNPTNPEFGAVASIVWNDPTTDPTLADYQLSSSQVPFEVNGFDPERGAPFANPCPPTAPARAYRATAFDLDLTVNNTGWHDPQARIAALDDDVAAMQNGTKPAEPLFFRANSNDCITYYHTNKSGAKTLRDAFQVETPTDTIGQHIHLVKFDVTSSDGSGNGWNYEDGTFAHEEIVERLEAMGHPGGHPAATGHGDYQTTTQRWWADPLLNAMGTDRTIRTVFTHDHFGPSTIQQHGYYAALVVEPRGSTWWDSISGGQLGTRPSDGGPTSWRADIRTDNGPIREFCLAVADFGIVLDEQRNPIKPPGPPGPGEGGGPIFVGPNGERFTPEAISADDPGTYLFNYRNEPIPLRVGQIPPNGSRFTNQLKGGAQGQMANVFSSTVHGADPATPLLTAYQGDNVQIRLIQGAQEESHAFDVNRAVWRREVSVPESGYTNTQHIGISEHFEMSFQTIARNPDERWRSADMMYSDRSEDGLWNGAWGLMRVYRDPNVLATGDPLPQPLQPVPPYDALAFASTFGSTFPCPTGAPVRTYNISAVLATDVGTTSGIVYNQVRDVFDDTGILFVRNEDLDPNGKYVGRLEPLVIRANAGDCLVVNLTNRLPAVVPDHPASDAKMPMIVDLNVHNLPVGNMVGWSIDAVYGDSAGTGAESSYIGRNQNRLVAPGATQALRYWCGRMVMDTGTGRLVPQKEEFGVCAIRSFGDLIKQTSQGLVGALVVEPLDSRWYATDGSVLTSVDNYGGTGVRAIVYPPTGAPFHEYVVVQQDGLNMLHSGAVLPDVSDDAEDNGEKAFNYRSIPFWAQLGNTFLDPVQLNDQDLSNVLLDTIDVPKVVVGAGQRVMFRVTEPAGRARAHTFGMSGHHWRDELANPLSNIQGQQTAHTIGTSWNLDLLHGAGGPASVRGDFLFRECASYQFSQGMWGLLRVRTQPMPAAPAQQPVGGGTLSGM